MPRPSRSERDRKVQPPRPPNAWILYRSYQFKQIRKNNERLSQAVVSKIISDMWKRESEEVKRQFEQEAETKKAQHQALYPDYRFCPKRKEPKQSRKKSKGRDATPSDADADDDNDDDDDVPPARPAIPPMPSMRQPQTLLVPGYHPNMAMSQPYMVPYMPEVHYGPGGPSPPISATPSPAPSESPLHPRSVASSSSSSSTRPSPSSESRASSSSLQLPANPIHLSSLPTSHYLTPNSYATPLSTLLFQNPTPGELRLTSPRLHLRSAENTVVPPAPVWSNISTYLPNPDSQNSEEAVNFDIPITQTQNFSEFQQGISSGSQFDPLQGLLSRTDESGVFNLSNIESSALLSHPDGDLEVAIGPLPSSVNYSEQLFADFDFDEFQRQMDSVREGDSSSSPHSRPILEDLQSLFHTPNSPEFHGYAAAQQRQPSTFTQDMMNFLNFEAAEGSTQDTSAAPAAPVPTTVAPQEVRLQNPQVATPMPIFTQMTNTPTVASGTSYVVPPAGAIYSSTRRLAGSRKPSFVNSPSQMGEPVHSWAL